jgi:PAS domain S-box-containing protein
MSEPSAPTLPASPFDQAPGSIFHAAREAIVTVDDQQRIIMINPAAQRMFGCTAADALGSSLSRFIPARHRAAHAVHVRDFEASERSEVPMGERGTITGLRANGEEFQAEAFISRVELAGADGTRHYVTALLRDLSHEQGLKAQLDAMKARMLSVFDLAPVAIWITDGEQIVFANRACAALFGSADSGALVGRSIYALLRPESHRAVRQKVAQALASDAPVSTVTERIARMDGSVREVVIAVAGLPDHSDTAVQMVITDITERAREGQLLERSRRELRRLSASLVNAREAERRRIARELHDELGQWLTALKMELSTLLPIAAHDELAQRVGSMVSIVDEMVSSVRRIASDLRPLMLDELGLNAAVEWLVRESSRRMGIEIVLRLEDADPPVSEAATIALYRMVQEALTNIARHARASEVRVELRRQSGEVLLTVQDNGVGFSEKEISREGSHGLMGIRERAHMLGGQLQVGNMAGGGGRLEVRLPIEADPSDAAASREVGPADDDAPAPAATEP